MPEKFVWWWWWVQVNFMISPTSVWVEIGLLQKQMPDCKKYGEKSANAENM